MILIDATCTDIRKYQNKVLSLKPIVHCITNNITIWDCANLLLAAGASPTMAHHPDEVAEITAGCHALVLNLGATESFDSMINAAPVAAAKNHPIVIDPVGCGGSSFRRNQFWEIAKVAHISCVRGNASEIMALAKGSPTQTGVDAGPLTSRKEFEDLKEAAAHLAAALGAIVIASGPVDLITDGTNLAEIHAGDPMMSRITGSGCMSTALLGAYLAADNSFESAIAAVTTMCKCGEVAADRSRKEGRGTMTFHTYLIDEMSLI